MMAAASGSLQSSVEVIPEIVDGCLCLESEDPRQVIFVCGFTAQKGATDADSRYVSGTQFSKSRIGILCVYMIKI